MWSSTLIDELGYLPFEAHAAHLFFQLVSRRYERGSILITSNRSVGEWGEVFGDAVVATAILTLTRRCRPTPPFGRRGGCQAGRPAATRHRSSLPTLDVANVRGPSRLSLVRYVTVWGGRGVDERGAAGALPGATAGRRVPDPVPAAGGPEVAATAVERRGADAPGAAGPVPGVGDGLPESLAESATAALLDEVCDLDLSELEAVELPKGFGRDG